MSRCRYFLVLCALPLSLSLLLSFFRREHLYIFFFSSKLCAYNFVRQYEEFEYFHISNANKLSGDTRDKLNSRTQNGLNKTHKTKWFKSKRRIRWKCRIRRREKKTFRLNQFNGLVTVIQLSTYNYKSNFAIVKLADWDSNGLLRWS